MTAARGWIRRVLARRLRLLSAALLALGLASAVLTVLQQIDPRRGGALAGLFAVVAAVIPVLENYLRERKRRADEDAERQADVGAKELEQLGPSARADLLDQVRSYWVETELERSLDKLAGLDPRLVERPGAVDNPLRSILRPPDEPDRLLEQGTPIAYVYHEVDRQLLILGAAGAGKTTLLLELARELLEEAIDMPSAKMPVVFHLSTWAVERPPLAAWLVDELHLRYGVTPRLGRNWVNGEQVIPLLDGLDEVPGDHRDACVEAINCFHDDHGQLPLVVCSRTTEYEALRSRLRLRGAVVIQPLARADVNRYLRAAGARLAGLRSVLREDEQLWELLTSPLLLSVVALAYRDKPAAAVRASDTVEERRRRVLDDYVHAMLSRPRASDGTPAYGDEQTTSWLAWLARVMSAHGQSVFYLDWMQPDWLPSRAQRRLVTAGTAVAAGLACGLASGLGAGLNALVSGQGQYLTNALGTGVVFGLIVGLVAYEPAIAPTERLRWSWAGLLHHLPRLLATGLLGGLLFGLVFGLIVLALGGTLSDVEPLVLLVAGMVVFGILGALVTGVVFGPVSALEPRLNVTPAAPGWGMRTSRRNALVGGLVGGLLGALTGGLVGGLIGGPVAGLSPPPGSAQQNLALALGLDNGLDFALVFGLIAWLRRGGGALMRHLALRRLLVRSGCAPRDYVAFLDHATRLILLRRRGGGYEFVHRLLLEHFAEPGSRTPPR
jgi:NACHT domain